MESLYLLNSNSPFPLPLNLSTTILVYVFMSLTSSDTSYNVPSVTVLFHLT